MRTMSCARPPMVDDIEMLSSKVEAKIKKDAEIGRRKAKTIFSMEFPINVTTINNGGISITSITQGEGGDGNDVLSKGYLRTKWSEVEVNQHCGSSHLCKVQLPNPHNSLKLDLLHGDLYTGQLGSFLRLTNPTNVLQGFKILCNRSAWHHFVATPRCGVIPSGRCVVISVKTKFDQDLKRCSLTNDDVAHDKFYVEFFPAYCIKPGMKYCGALPKDLEQILLVYYEMLVCQRSDLIHSKSIRKVVLRKAQYDHKCRRNSAPFGEDTEILSVQRESAWLRKQVHQDYNKIRALGSVKRIFHGGIFFTTCLLLICLFLPMLEPIHNSASPNVSCRVR